MLKRIVAPTMLLLLLFSLLALVSSTKPAKAWNGTVYIETNGSVNPSDAPIGRSGNVYTLTDDIYSDGDGIIVLCDNSIIDGAGHMIQGANATYSIGISLSGRSGITIRNLQINSFDYGIFLYQSSSNSITGNDITTNYYGIWLFSSSGNNITTNEATANSAFGIGLYSSSNNNIQGNNVTYNGNGIGLDSTSSNNAIFHNNFEANIFQAQASESYDNSWDEGYPSGGNYWSDYNGTDHNCGPNQDHPGSDGIGDTPYTIDSNNKDNYPIVNPWTPPAGHNVAVISIVSSKTVIGQGLSGNITVYGANKGEYSETLNITLYANATAIASKAVPLNTGSTATIIFSWNTTSFSKGNYTVSAYAHPVNGETGIGDNNFTDGWVVVSIVGDITGPQPSVPDGKCNILDIARVARGFGQSVPPASPESDITGTLYGVPDGKVNILDISLVARHFGEPH